MWTDCTTYSRGDKERKQTCFEIKGKVLRIVVTCNHVNAPKEWVMHCHPWYNTYLLNVSTVSKAKKKAISLVKRKASLVMNDIDLFAHIS